MNYLAHTFLSAHKEPLLMGNLVADWISNKDALKLPPEILAGISLHRNIDRYTDNHKMVRRGVRRLQTKYRKYSPVIIDIFYDHLLFKNWAEYSSHDYNQFKAITYDKISNHPTVFPAYIQRRLDSMVEHDWLQSYTSIERMHFVFKRLKLRTKFSSQIELAANDLEKDYLKYESEFNDFFPDIISYVENIIRSSHPSK